MATPKASRPHIEYDLYLRVVAMSATQARDFFGIDADPVDLGPPTHNNARYHSSARVWGFLSRPETPAEKAHRIWTVAQGGSV